jgi:hypothetical protein
LLESAASPGSGAIPARSAGASIPRLSLVATAILIAVLGATGWFFMQQHRAWTRSEAESELTGIADLKASQIGIWMKERRGDAHMASLLSLA